MEDLRLTLARSPPGKRKLFLPSQSKKMVNDDSKLLVNRSIDSLRRLVKKSSSKKLESMARSMRELAHYDNNNKPGEDSTHSMTTASTEFSEEMGHGEFHFYASLENEVNELSDEFAGVDMEEQRRLLEFFESEKSKALFGQEDTAASKVLPEKNADDSFSTEELVRQDGASSKLLESLPPQNVIQVAPGIELPLRSSNETWHAITEGRVIVSSCCCCSEMLTCIEDAAVVACADCWVFSPVEDGHSSAKNTNERKHGVCIGVKQEDILEWLKESSSSNPQKSMNE